MSDLHVEIDLLDKLSKAWSNNVKDGLSEAATKIDGLKFSRFQAGIFQIPWSRYIETATYLQERLREGADQAERIGSTLHNASTSFDRQDSERAQEMRQYGDMDFSI